MCWGLTSGAEAHGTRQSPDKRGPDGTPALEGQPQRTIPETGEERPGKRIRRRKCWGTERSSALRRKKWLEHISDTEFLLMALNLSLTSF